MNDIKMKIDFSRIKTNSDWTFDKHKYENYSHNYHRYPAKFIPPIANRIIAESSKKGDIVCDFFGGCGTTLVEAKLLGRRSIGLDINPIATFITKVKLHPIEPRLLEKEYQLLMNRLRGEIIQNNDPLSPKNKRLYYWFSESQYKQLRFLYQGIIDCDHKATKHFFLCAFSHCLKNSSRWLMKSIKPTVDKQKKEADPVKIFLRHLKAIIIKNNLFYSKLRSDGNLTLSSKVYCQDSTNPRSIRDSSVDLIITSPPYVTSYEYADLHQLTLLWFEEDAKNFTNWKYTDDFALFKSRFIGSSHTKKSARDEYFNSKIASLIVEKLKKEDNSLARKVVAYFNEMNLVFNQMYRILKRDKEANIIIGNTKLRGVSILNAEVCLEQMLAAGFKQVKVIKRNSMTNKMIAPYRDKKTGRFTSLNNPNKATAYHEEFLIKVTK